MIADIDEKNGKAVEEELVAKGLPVTFIKASVSDDASLNSMIAKAVSIYGTIEYAVNTAGITGPSVEAHELEDADWHKVITIDLEGTWRFSKAIIKFWRTQEPRLVRDDHEERPEWEPVVQRGSLVNTASSLGSEGKAFLGVYCECTVR